MKKKEEKEWRQGFDVHDASLKAEVVATSSAYEMRQSFNAFVSKS